MLDFVDKRPRLYDHNIARFIIIIIINKYGFESRLRSRNLFQLICNCLNCNYTATIISSLNLYFRSSHFPHSICIIIVRLSVYDGLTIEQVCCSTICTSTETYYPFCGGLIYTANQNISCHQWFKSLHKKQVKMEEKKEGRSPEE